MIRTGHHILSILALSVIAIAVVGCGPTGSLGTVPPVSRTPAPSVDPGPPDITPEPSADAVRRPDALRAPQPVAGEPDRDAQAHAYPGPSRHDGDPRLLRARR